MKGTFESMSKVQRVKKVCGSEGAHGKRSIHYPRRYADKASAKLKRFLHSYLLKLIKKMKLKYGLGFDSSTFKGKKCAELNRSTVKYYTKSEMCDFHIVVCVW